MRGLTCDEVRELAGAFVLGALEPADDAAVRAHLATCPEAHEEIAELGGVLPVLGESVPLVEPPDGLRARIMAAAADACASRSAIGRCAAPPRPCGRRRARLPAPASPRRRARRRRPVPHAG